jgi:hypothetical protein
VQDIDEIYQLSLFIFHSSNFINVETVNKRKYVTILSLQALSLDMASSLTAQNMYYFSSSYCAVSQHFYSVFFSLKLLSYLIPLSKHHFWYEKIKKHQSEQSIKGIYEYNLIYRTIMKHPIK